MVVNVNSSSSFLGFLFLGSLFLSFNFFSMFLYYRRSESPSFPGHLPFPEDFRPLWNSSRKYHVALTATDTPYSKWQSRVVYYSYRKIKDMNGSDMGGFTRILHSGKPDNLMEEIPTFVVNPLPDGQDRGYPPMNRPWAFVQWLEKARFDEEYVLMVEPDHIFVKPLPNLAFGELPAAFPFFYMTPTEKEAAVRKFYPVDRGPLTNVDPIGSSPVIIEKFTLKKIASTWIKLSMKMKEDPECDKAFGWISEMYAYTVAAALHDVRHMLYKDFMVQPPFETTIGNAFIIHYTYGMNFNSKGEPVDEKLAEWKFDKRTYSSAPPPRNLSLPPPGAPETVVRVIEAVNEASANLPNWSTQS